MSLFRILLLAGTTVFFRCGTNPVAPIEGPEGWWVLESFGPVGQEAPVLEGTAITAEFAADRRLSGSGGCNEYGATFRHSGANGLRIYRLGSTRLRCTAPPGVSDQESEYFDALRRVHRFERSGDALVLHYQGGSGRLRFRPQE